MVTSVNRQWWILVATGIMIMLVNIDLTVVNLALAKMAIFFHASMNQVQWIISSYLLATALSFVIFGRLADHWGRKRIFFVGVLLFTFSSLLAGFTDHLHVLVLARFIQGLGFAGTLSLAIILIVNAFPEQQKGFATGIAITITGLSQAIGPTIGGTILQYLDWHWIFLLNVPLGILSFIMTSVVTPNDASQKSAPLPFKLFDTFLFVSGLGLILYAFNQISVIDFKYFIIATICGLLFLILFVKNCHKSSKPLLEVELLTNRGYLYVVLSRLIFMGTMCALFFLLPLYLQNMLNYSPLAAGLMMLLMTGFVAIASPITGKWLDIIGFYAPLTLSFILGFFSIFFMLAFASQGSVLLLIVSFMLFGLAIGVHTPASINGAMSQVPKEKAATAMGLFFTAAMTGATLWVAMTGTLMSMISKHFLQLALVNSSLPMEMRNNLAHVASGAYNINHLGLTAQQIMKFQPLTQYAFMNAFHVQIGVFAFLMLVALVICWRLKSVLKAI